MGLTKNNSFRMKSDGTLTPVIPSHIEIGGRTVALPFSRYHDHEFRGNVERVVVVGHDLLRIALQGEPYVDDGYCAVLMDFRMMDFGGKPFASGLDVWPGSEWHSESSFWSVAEVEGLEGAALRRTPDKFQLEVLPRGGRRVLADRYGGLRMLEYPQKGVSPEIREPTVLEAADYFSARGRAAATHRAVDWAWHNLKALEEAFPEHHKAVSRAQGAVRTNLERLSRVRA